MNFPKREHYEEFVQRLSRGLLPETCFYLYGSFIREKDFVPGRSDLDGGVIFDSEFITPKTEVRDIARYLDKCLRGAEESAGISSFDPGITLNFNLMDRAINRDGRFLAYDDTYTDYLKANARIAVGPDFVQEMNGMNYKRESLRSSAYNLRKVRNGLLSYFVDLRKNPQRARKNVLSSMNILWGMPKKILESLGKELKFEQDAFFETFMAIFPDYNSGIYEKIASIRKNPDEYFGVFERGSPYDTFQTCVAATEKMIQDYVKRFPHPSRLEVNSLD